MTLWFAASAVVPQLTTEWNLSEGQRSWMTMSVQIGFVVGALLSAVVNLPDRVSARCLVAVSALAGAAFNAAIALFDPDPDVALVMRFLTGVAMAGVYPPGMKLAISWCREDRGLGIGLLVGALVLGSACPHLLNGLSLFGTAGMPPWRGALLASSVMAVAGALIVGLFFREGPARTQSAPFDWRFVGRAFAHRPTRLANLGYFGHMWELYAMWTWVPILLLKSFESGGRSASAARLAGFATIAVGAAGSVVAGVFADRIGRTKVAIWSLVVSGTCALFAGAFYSSPVLLTALCLVWGFAVVADSAQFSAAVSELTDPRYVGTALALQTSLGFLLTLLTIRLVPTIAAHPSIGWERVFMILALGPAFGIWSMLKLRQSPEATKMASGNR